MKSLFLIFFSFFIAYGFSQEDLSVQLGRDALPKKFIKTSEDATRLQFFHELFQTHPLLKKKVGASSTIPKTIHFIWLGPEKFPSASKYRLLKWVERHPTWNVCFWSDTDQGAPVSRMEKRDVSQFSFQVLRDQYDSCENYGEKAKLLAYEILLQEGGVYVDHDVFPFKSFDELNSQLDFYCGLETLGPTILSTSVIPSTHLIGAKPHHPVIEEAVLWLRQNWDRVEESFTGRSASACKSRVYHRGFWALAEGIDRGISKEGNQDIVFPPSYFSEKKRSADSFAIHEHRLSWLRTPSSFEVKMEKKLEKILKKDTEMILLTLLLAGASFIGSVFLLIFARTRDVK